jgi:hypothetical protein
MIVTIVLPSTMKDSLRRRVSTSRPIRESLGAVFVATLFLDLRRIVSDPLYPGKLFDE